MISPFLEYTRCPEHLFASLLPDSETLYSLPLVRKGMIELPADAATAIDHLRLERYLDNRITDLHTSLNPKTLIRNTYYVLRPLLSVGMRKHLQRFALRGWRDIPFPAWPVDTTVEEIVESTWLGLLEAQGCDRLPFVWFWPDNHRACAVMTHDVETAAGRDFCGRLIAMEAEFGIVSSFEVVPEERYEVTPEFLESIRQAGCEVCLHGLNHDGHLFSSKAGFRKRAARINDYAAAWGAVGFRSPVMYRNLDLLGELDISYDMSMPNVGHLDPQRGGCCTVMPYFIGKTLELPLTTIQDYPLFNNLGRYDMEIWRRQMEIILGKNGLLSFIIHPDYTVDQRAQDLYRELLEFLAGLRDSRGVWLPLPREVDAWWRLRNGMDLAEKDGRWSVTGPGSERARVAFVYREEGKVVYRVEQDPVLR